MKQEQVNNIINFSFHFHRSMGCKIKEFSPDYLEEKFNSYFGMKPKKITSTEFDILDHYLDFIEWKKMWKREYTDHLWFIYQLNKKSFSVDHKHWKPNELISLFEECVGDPNLILYDTYYGLHTILKQEVTKWLSKDKIKNDYRSIIRDIKIDTILSQD